MIHFTRNTFLTCVVFGLTTLTLFGAEPESVLDAGLYDSYAQNEPSAPVTLMPQAGVPNEDVYQDRAAAPEEGYNRGGCDEIPRK